MKKKILIAIYIVLLLTTLKLLYNIITNSILINKYNNGEYSETYAKALTSFNFPESYIANYNYGNIHYQKGEYEKAIEEYKKSLNGIIPQDKECNIRINYALAICNTVEVNEKEQESIENAIKIYESAIDVLTKNGCANKNNNNGHSQKAEQLKKDIQKEIDRLKKLQKNESSDSKDNEDKEENKEQNETETETIEEKLKDIKEQATKGQKEKENKTKTIYTYNEYNGGKKNW